MATFIDKVTESGGEFTILGKVATDLTAIKDAMSGDMKATLGEVAKFSVDQTNKSIVNTKAQSQVDWTVDLKADLTQNLDIDVKIGDRQFADAVKQAIGVLFFFFKIFLIVIFLIIWIQLFKFFLNFVFL